MEGWWGVGIVGHGHGYNLLCFSSHSALTSSRSLSFSLHKRQFLEEAKNLHLGVRAIPLSGCVQVCILGQEWQDNEDILLKQKY